MKVKKDFNKQKFVGFALPYNSVANSEISEARHYVVAWQGYAVVINIETEEKENNKPVKLTLA